MNLPKQGVPYSATMCAHPNSLSTKRLCMMHMRQGSLYTRGLPVCMMHMNQGSLYTRGLPVCMMHNEPGHSVY